MCFFYPTKDWASRFWFQFHMILGLLTWTFWIAICMHIREYLHHSCSNVRMLTCNWYSRGLVLSWYNLSATMRFGSSLNDRLKKKEVMNSEKMNSLRDKILFNFLRLLRLQLIWGHNWQRKIQQNSSGVPKLIGLITMFLRGFPFSPNFGGDMVILCKKIML